MGGRGKLMSDNNPFKFRAVRVSVKTLFPFFQGVTKKYGRNAMNVKKHSHVYIYIYTHHVGCGLSCDLTVNVLCALRAVSCNVCNFCTYFFQDLTRDTLTNVFLTRASHIKCVQLKSCASQ